MFVIGLTGGIGSGKSTVADLFSKQDACVIDTDIIAREVVTPGMPALEQITEHFGTQVLLADGALNRKKLREVIFNDQPAKEWLENLLHPLIWQEAQTQIKQKPAAYHVLVVPLLIEAGLNSEVDRTLVIDCPRALQVSRTMARDQSAQNLVENIVDSQISREQRLTYADDVIYNDQDLNNLEQQVKQLNDNYLILAQQTSVTT